MCVALKRRGDYYAPRSATAAACCGAPIAPLDSGLTRRMLHPHRRRHQADLTRLFNAEALTSPPFGQLLAAQFARALGAVALAAFGAPNALAAHTAALSPTQCVHALLQARAVQPPSEPSCSAPPPSPQLPSTPRSLLHA